MTPTIKRILGAIIFDAPRYLFHFLLPPKLGKSSWIYIKNRNETIKKSTTDFSAKCVWEWTSDLHLPSIFPLFGQILFNKAFLKYPIDTLENKTSTTSPDVTFIIGHRGMERLPLMLRTIETILAQKKCSIECIVVEQDVKPLIKKFLPKNVVYVFTPTSIKNVGYSRSWSFNVGAKHASSDCLIFHDNDILIPSCYASEVLARYKQGYEFINLKRFVFYLNQSSTDEFLLQRFDQTTFEFDAITQNAEGGVSFGASKKTYFEIGGFDESFIGWGGEDNEFWERAETRKVWAYTHLPFIHLWHPTQPEKNTSEVTNTMKLYLSLSKVAPSIRINRLTSNNEKF